LEFVHKRYRVEKENIRSDQMNQQNVRIMKELLKTVNYLHKNGIFHRDLKPGNIIIDSKDLRPHIIDFGLS
jgi:serine/threonine protein kinase